MDASPVVWFSDSVRAAVASGNVGAIIRSVRLANNLTLSQLAARCGYSPSSLSRMETGKQPLRDVEVLRSFARALGIPATLLGVADTPPRSGSPRRSATRVSPVLAPDEGIDPMRRRTLLTGMTSLAGAALLGGPAAAMEQALLNPPMRAAMPTPLPRLVRDVAGVHATFQRGHYAEVARQLPALVSTTMATRAEMSSSVDIEAANSQLAALYTLASELMIKLGDDGLAWLSADRALEAAYASGDLLSVATARRAWAIMLRRTGRTQTAQQLVVDTAAALQPQLNKGPEYLSVYGSLLATAAYTAATDGDRDTAHTLTGEAVDAARWLGADRNDRFTTFGPTEVRLYEVNIARVLGDAGTAIEHARRVNPTAIPFAERRARFWANVARSLDQWGRPEECFRALLAAEQASADEVRYRKPIQEITIKLLRHPTARRLPGLDAFAHRTGALRTAM